jgi:hypothetical protein
MDASNVLMTLVFVLGGFFGLLSVVAFGVRKLIDAIKRRRRRRRQRRIEAAFANMPLVQDRPVEGPRAPRVLYVPKHDDEAQHEADMVVPVAFIGWDYAKPEAERTEVFVGKGGQAGGAGASGDWQTEEKSEPEAETTTDAVEDTSSSPSES